MLDPDKSDPDKLDPDKLDPDKGMYYELNPVATRIRRLLDTARAVAEVCDVLIGEYGVPRMSAAATSWRGWRWRTSRGSSRCASPRHHEVLRQAR